jgi:hypothetical protein
MVSKVGEVFPVGKIRSESFFALEYYNSLFRWFCKLLKLLWLLL